MTFKVIEMQSVYIYTYIYAFSRRFYPKRLTVHSGYTCFCQYMCSLGIEPTTFALLTQCSTTEPQEHMHHVSTCIMFKFYSQNRKQWLFASVSQHLMCMCCRWSWPWLLSADGFQTWGKRTVSCDLLGESLITVWMMSGDFIFLSSSDRKQLLMSHTQ